MKKVLALVLLIFAPLPAAFATSTAPSLPADSSQQDKNKAIARRVLEEILNQGKFQVADEIYAQDFVNHGLHRNADLQADQAAARWEKKTLPDMTLTVDLMLAEGDLVTVVWTLHGTNSVPIGILPATGVGIEERGITVWRIVDGKIRDEWTSFDQLRIVRQIVSQLKWQLMGLLGAVVIVIWVATRFIRKLWLMYSTQAAKATP
jgi:predicted ester cyclase